MASISADLAVSPRGGVGDDERLSPIGAGGSIPRSPAEWQVCRTDILARVTGFLGAPAEATFSTIEQQIGAFDLPECHVSMHLIPTSPTTNQTVAVLTPLKATTDRAPLALIPFYNPDLMVGYDLTTDEPKEAPAIHFGRHLVQQGYTVVCGQAFPYNTVPDPQSDAAFAWWHAATDKILAENPNWTGMGKLVHDTRCMTNFALSLPGIDSDRVVIAGHSLGGKMAFYAGCLDERIHAILACDFGIGLTFTNWDAPWYLGERVRQSGFPYGHHELLALNAPDSFFLIAGQADRVESWQYIDAARPIYDLVGRKTAMGMVNHATGHRPPLAAMRTAYAWLAEQFGLPQREYTI